VKPTLKECVFQHHNWEPFFYDQKPVTIVLKINIEKTQDKIINYHTVPKSKDFYKFNYIPYVESWYPEPIPFDFIDSFRMSFFDEKKSVPHFEGFDKENINEFVEKIFTITNDK